jgi:chemotaxis protein methyltransferase CheR
VARHYGYDFRRYARHSMGRCIRQSMVDEDVLTVSALQDRLLHDADSFARFLGMSSVQVTAMFRDPPFYQAIRDLVVPILRTYPLIRVWHAGCSTGEEAYSLAILLHEVGLYERCRIYATDLNETLLDRAKSGILDLASLQSNAINYRRAGGRGDFLDYCQIHARHAVLKAELRRNILFTRHSLATDGSFNEFQLILCRNVMIYFSPDLRYRVHKLIHDSLSRFGFLGLGHRESLRHSHFSAHYEPMDSRTRLYRRVQ